MCSLRSESTQCKLLSQHDLTLTQAVDIAKGMEAATRNTHELQGQASSVQAIKSFREKLAPKRSHSTVVVRPIMCHSNVILKMQCAINAIKRDTFQRFANLLKSHQCNQRVLAQNYKRGKLGTS